MSTGSTIHIVFDGPPDAVAGRFVEVENSEGGSIKVGEWRDRGDGFWELIINRPGRDLTEYANLCAHGAILCAPCGYIPENWRQS